MHTYICVFTVETYEIDAWYKNIIFTIIIRIGNFQESHGFVKDA